MKLDSKDIIVVIIIIVIALSAGLLSAYQYIDSAKKDEKNDETTEKLIKAQQEINVINHQISDAQQTSLTLSKELKISQQKSIEKSDALIDAQSKINVLQSEIISQVVGKGYPVLKLMNAQGSNFKIYLQPSTDYPVYKVYFRLVDSQKLLDCKAVKYPTKVEIDKLCYDNSLIIEPNQSLDLNGKLMNFIGSEIPKKNYYLMTEFMCKNIKVIQYSIVKYDGVRLQHDYRIYEVSRDNASFLGLLENSNAHITEEEYEKNFFLAKTIIIDSSK